jgi:hypothetical protein
MQPMLNLLLQYIDEEGKRGHFFKTNTNLQKKSQHQVLHRGILPLNKKARLGTKPSPG